MTDHATDPYRELELDGVPQDFAKVLRLIADAAAEAGEAVIVVCGSVFEFDPDVAAAHVAAVWREAAAVVTAADEACPGGSS